MADSLPSPPASRSSTPETPTKEPQSSSSDLSQRLDKLLEQYLELLDQYSTLREELSKAFSNGFFSLANAQRTANLGPGRRYGAEGYDGRMKALRRVRIASNKDLQANKHKEERSIAPTMETAPPHTFSIVDDKLGSNGGDPSNTNERIPTEKGTPEAAKDTVPEDISSPTQKPDPAYRDPASWYGLLVPQNLRQTQKSFVTLIETTVPALVNTMSAMTVLEEEIWSVRKTLGVEQEYSQVQNDSRNTGHDPLKEIDKLLAKAKV